MATKTTGTTRIWIWCRWRRNWGGTGVAAEAGVGVRWSLVSRPRWVVHTVSLHDGVAGLTQFAVRGELFELADAGLAFAVISVEFVGAFCLRKS